MASKTEQRIPITFRCDEPLYRSLQEIAEKEHQTMSGLIRKFLTALVESYQG